MARLLVSVMDADEALTARAAGADIVDAKDPRAGALGAVTTDVLRTIRDALPPDTPLSVALGDAADVDQTRALARFAAAQGATFVKLGFAGRRSGASVRAQLSAAREAVGSGGAGAGVIAVAYADAACVDTMEAGEVLAAAASSAAVGVLLDTARKDAPGSLDLWPRARIRDWIADAHAARLLVAIAGRVDLGGVARAAELGADVIGVRGAACDGGRLGRVSDARVRLLVDAAHG